MAPPLPFEVLPVEKMVKAESGRILLVAKGLTKAFPGVLAVDHVDFELRAGEIHGLVGENGAGKSTLVGMLDGSILPDEGEIIFENKKLKMSSPQEAFSKGIAMVPQEIMLLPHLSVAENVVFPLFNTSRLKWINWKHINDFAASALKEFGISLDVRRITAELSVAEQQIVAIARAVVANAKVLILDEPTSALARHDVENLFRVMSKLKARGVGIIFISHRLDEILEVSDTVTVLRDGRKIGDFSACNLSEDLLAELIVGKPMREKYPKIFVPVGKPILKVKNLCVGTKVKQVSFTVKEGEILGIVGALGSGKTEIALTLFGAPPAPWQGEIEFQGSKIRLNSPNEAIRKGIALVPEDRRGLGLILNQSVRFNISLPNLEAFRNRIKLLSIRKERELAHTLVEQLKIKCSSVEQLVEFLSGGNQQKVVVAKWLGSSAKVLLLDEPTRGIDVGAKIEMYRVIGSLAKSGLGIIIFTSEVPEACGIADRILILAKGEVVRELTREEAQEHEVQRLVLVGGGNGKTE